MGKSWKEILPQFKKQFSNSKYLKWTGYFINRLEFPNKDSLQTQAEQAYDKCTEEAILFSIQRDTESDDLKRTP